MRIWTNDEPVTVTIQRTNVAEQIADDVLTMLKAGTPRAKVAKRLEVSPTMVDRAWRLGMHGIDRSDYDPSLKAYNPPRRPDQPEQVMEQVAELRHNEGLAPDQIAERLGISCDTVGRAHRLWHQRHPDQPGDIPWKVLCGRSGKLSPAQRRRVCELAMAGHREYQIVEKLGYDKGHVHRVLTALNRELARLGRERY